jgi:hypothetical protein
VDGNKGLFKIELATIIEKSLVPFWFSECNSNGR